MCQSYSEALFLSHLSGFSVEVTDLTPGYHYSTNLIQLSGGCYTFGLWLQQLPLHRGVGLTSLGY